MSYAASFIEYDPMLKMFSHRPKGIAKSGVYSIGIKITDKNGRRTQYELLVDYKVLE